MYDNMGNKKRATCFITMLQNELTLGRTRRGGGGGWMTPPYSYSEFFFLEDETSALDVFNSCSFIPCAHFETSLVMGKK